MGMFDDIIIKEDLVELGIPKGNYQTKDFNNSLDTYSIDKDGNILLINMLDLEDSKFWEDTDEPIKLPSKMTGIDFHLNMYGDKIYYKGKVHDWLDLVLTVKDGRVVNVEHTSCYPKDYIEADMTKVKWAHIENINNDPKCEGCGRVIDTTPAEIVQSWNSPTGLFLKGYCPNCDTKFMVTERTSVDKNLPVLPKKLQETESKDNNFDDYHYVYKDMISMWNIAKNPVFIAKHTYCRAVEKKKFPDVKELLNLLNNGKLTL